MSLSVTCPHCSEVLKLRDESKIGQRVKCPNCQKGFVASPDEEFVSEFTAARPKRKGKGSKRSKGSSPLPWILGGGVALVCVVGALWGLGLFGKGDNEQAPPVATQESPAAPAVAASPPPTPVPAATEPVPLAMESAQVVAAAQPASTPLTGSPATETSSPPPTPEEVKPVAASAPVVDTVDPVTFEHVPGDAMAIAVVRLSRVHSAPPFQSVVAEILNIDPVIERDFGQELSQAEMFLQLPVFPYRKAEYMSIAVTFKDLVDLAMQSTGSPKKDGKVQIYPTIAFHFGESFDFQEGLSALLDYDQDVKETKIGERTLYERTNGSAFSLLEPKTLVLGHAGELTKILSAESKKICPLVEKIRPLTDRDVAVAIDFSKLQANRDDKEGVAGLGAELTTMAQDAGFVQMALDLNGPTLGELQYLTSSEELATKIASKLSDAFTRQADRQLEPFVQRLSSTPGAEGLLSLISKTVKSHTTGTTGTMAWVRISQPEEMKDLANIVRPYLEGSLGTKDERGARDSLEWIAMAMWNHLFSHGHFPAHDSNGGQGDKRTGVGLSWRVHLLPYIKQDDLYKQFHLDEPWDSEHNQTLIAKMPSTYGTSPEGKTSYHIFIGPNSPFAGPGGPTDQTLKDGPNKTILAVKAGDDTAEIWTKPGGLKVDPKDQLACLGQVGSKIATVSFRETFVLFDSDRLAKNLARYVDPDDESR